MPFFSNHIVPSRSRRHMNLIEHAKNEFKLAGWIELNDDMQNLMMKNLLELLKVVSGQGHSGFSVSYLAEYFNRLLLFKPITPLTGKDVEWEEVSKDLMQNKRCPEVFKEISTGKAYWIRGKIFRDKNGSTYTNKNSLVYIDFPWNMPEPEVVDVEEDEDEDKE